MTIIKYLVAQESTIYTDKWKDYDSLVIDGYKHGSINHWMRGFNKSTIFLSVAVVGGDFADYAC